MIGNPLIPVGLGGHHQLPKGCLPVEAPGGAEHHKAICPGDPVGFAHKGAHRRGADGGEEDADFLSLKGEGVDGGVAVAGRNLGDAPAGEGGEHRVEEYMGKGDDTGGNQVLLCPVDHLQGDDRRGMGIKGIWTHKKPPDTRNLTYNTTVWDFTQPS